MRAQRRAAMSYIVEERYDELVDFLKRVFKKAQRVSFADLQTLQAYAEDPSLSSAGFEAIEHYLDRREAWSSQIAQALVQNPNLPISKLKEFSAEYPHEVLQNPIFDLLVLEDPMFLAELGDGAKLSLFGAAERVGREAELFGAPETFTFRYVQVAKANKRGGGAYVVGAGERSSNQARGYGYWRPSKPTPEDSWGYYPDRLRVYPAGIVVADWADNRGRKVYPSGDDFVRSKEGAHASGINTLKEYVKFSDQRWND